MLISICFLLPLLLLSSAFELLQHHSGFGTRNADSSYCDRCRNKVVTCQKIFPQTPLEQIWANNFLKCLQTKVVNPPVSNGLTDHAKAKESCLLAAGSLCKQCAVSEITRRFQFCVVSIYSEPPSPTQGPSLTTPSKATPMAQQPTASPVRFVAAPPRSMPIQRPPMPIRINPPPMILNRSEKTLVVKPDKIPMTVPQPTYKAPRNLILPLMPERKSVTENDWTKADRRRADRQNNTHPRSLTNSPYTKWLNVFRWGWSG